MDQLTELVSRIEKEAGFELYLFASALRLSQEINDFGSSQNTYARAIHNLVEPDTGLRTKIESAVHVSVGGRLGDSDLSNLEIVAYGLLPKKVQKTVKQNQWVTQKSSKLWGLAGKLGFEKTCYQPVDVSATFYEGSQPLSDVVKVNNDNQAHYVTLTIAANSLAVTGQRPTLTIVADKELATQIVTYLSENPNHYYDFIRAVLPKEKFPNSNKILDRIEPATRIGFLDSDSLTQTAKPLGLNNLVEPKFFEENCPIIDMNYS